MSEVPYKVVGKKDGRRTWYHILDANKNTVDTWPERGHAVAACSLANYAHAHATDAAARRVRELENNCEWLRSQWERHRKALNAIAWGEYDNVAFCRRLAQDELAIGVKAANDRATATVEALAGKERSDGDS